MRFIVGMLMVASVSLCISAVTVPVKLHDNAEMYEERAITANKIADYFEKRAKDHCKICAGEVESCILNGGKGHPAKPAHECWVKECQENPNLCGGCDSCKNLGNKVRDLQHAAYGFTSIKREEDAVDASQNCPFTCELSRSLCMKDPVIYENPGACNAQICPAIRGCTKCSWCDSESWTPPA